MFTCQACKQKFDSNQAQLAHMYRSPYCRSFSITLPNNSNLIQQHNDVNLYTNLVDNELFSLETYMSEEEDKANCNFDNNDEDNEDTSSTSSYNSTNKNAFYQSNEIIHEIKLLKILTDISAPLYAYKSIMEWAHNAYSTNYKLDTKRKTYQQTIKYLENNLQFDVCRPKHVHVKLIGDK